MSKEPIKLEGVVALYFSGTGIFSVSNDGIVTCSHAKMTISDDGKSLTYEGRGGGNTVIMSGGGGMIVQNSQGVSQINTGSVGGGMFTFNNHAGSSVSNISAGGKSITIVDDVVYINGKRAMTDDEPVAEDKSLKKEQVYQLSSTTTRISKITVKGPFSVNAIPSTFMDTQKCEATVIGSGDITLPNITFDQLNIVVQGSGDILGGTAKQASIMLSGSGDVGKLHILEQASIMLNGSGDVRITKAPDAKITKMKNGSGDVSIYTKK